MIAFVRIVSVMPGKTADALAFAHHLKSYLKDKHGIDMNLSMPIGGNPNRIAYVSNVASLGELEAGIAKLAADAEYQKMIAGNAANVIPGSVHDEMWRSL